MAIFRTFPDTALNSTGNLFIAIGMGALHRLETIDEKGSRPTRKAIPVWVEYEQVTEALH